MISLQRLTVVLVLASACKEDAAAPARTPRPTAPVPTPEERRQDAAMFKACLQNPLTNGCDKRIAELDLALARLEASQAALRSTKNVPPALLASLDERTGTLVALVEDPRSRGSRETMRRSVDELAIEQDVLLEQAAIISDAVAARIETRDSDPEIQALRDSINAAVDFVVAAQTDEDRRKGKAQLDTIVGEHAELQQVKAKARLQEAVDEASKRPPPRYPVPGEKPRKPTTKECLENPLARGCS